MQREQVVAAIAREKVIGIVRLHDAAQVAPVVRAIHAGGVRCIEVSLTTPGALAAIAAAVQANPDALIGAGTVCSAEDAEAALQAGARFLVTPVLVPEAVPAAHAHEVPVVMGAFTPTEIHAAVSSGADLVKLFPAAALGPDYLRALRGPLPGVRLVPTGGVDAANARDWLAAGAVALGVGGGLTDANAIAAGRYDALTVHARQLMESVR